MTAAIVGFGLFALVVFLFGSSLRRHRHPVDGSYHD
jgi:hypothetical protein